MSTELGVGGRIIEGLKACGAPALAVGVVALVSYFVVLPPGEFEGQQHWLALPPAIIGAFLAYHWPRRSSETKRKKEQKRPSKSVTNYTEARLYASMFFVGFIALLVYYIITMSPAPSEGFAASSYDWGVLVLYVVAPFFLTYSITRASLRILQYERKKKKGS